MSKNNQGMNWIRQDKRLAIYLRDGLACVYCAASVEEGASLTLDHVHPVDKGGTNSTVNLVTSCIRCNVAKSTRNVREFINAVAAYLDHDIKAIDIHKHVEKQRACAVDVMAARDMIAKRGSTARVLAAIKDDCAFKVTRVAGDDKPYNVLHPKGGSMGRYATRQEAQLAANTLNEEASQ
jgi:hypothetical protein